MRVFKLLLAFTFFASTLCAKLPDITPQDVTSKLNEIMKAHASYKTLNSVAVERALQNYLEELDPTKTYFIESDIQEWIHPNQELLGQLLEDYRKSDFKTFKAIHDKMTTTIQRRHELEKQVDMQNLPSHVKIEDFKDLKWAHDNQELLNRLASLKALQMESVSKLSDELKEKSQQRIAKRQAKFEEEILTNDAEQKERYILTNVLKATASALDSHTAYFTPDEAAQFMISVQQRLFGIGAQLRDDINGFTIVKIVEGGPASHNKELKVKDRIIAVNGEPVVGMDIVDAVDLIRGEENTPVTLTVIREVAENQEDKLDITLIRGEVVLKETRYESSIEPFGDGVIAYLKLHSFYQDPEHSSAEDLQKEIKKLKDQYNIKGIILDLRSNSGGMLSQAVNVTGLFISKGIVVSIKDDAGHIQHLRNLDSKVTWDGPLIILVNRASASASEIVAQTLQDYGRAIVVGDDHTYGKGSFQTFTLNGIKNAPVNPKGEYKVTRGRYYTVSGKTPQLTGVSSSIIIPGPLSESEIGEKFGKYPLENDFIKENFDDDLSDIPYLQRERIRLLYKFDLQKKLKTYLPYIEILKKNSTYRITMDQNYQNFLKEVKKNKDIESDSTEEFGQNDLQLQETMNVMRDLIFLLHH
ncbi:Tail-specific protease [Chlamydiales bacterium STE3]|nr:Tail-specific protease [Chlamydiales bacterium STE3]